MQATPKAQASQRHVKHFCTEKKKGHKNKIDLNREKTFVNYQMKE